MIYIQSKPMCTIYSQKWTMHKHVSEKSKKCLSVGNSEILYVVVCVLALAYTSLCRGLQYLLKVRYIIVVNPNGAEVFIFETVILGRTAALPYV